MRTNITSYTFRTNNSYMFLLIIIVSLPFFILCLSLTNIFSMICTSSCRLRRSSDDKFESSKDRKVVLNDSNANFNCFVASKQRAFLYVEYSSMMSDLIRYVIVFLFNYYNATKIQNILYIIHLRHYNNLNKK